MMAHDSWRSNESVFQLSSTIINYHRLSSTIIDYHQLSSTIIDYHRLSSTIIDYHRLSSTIINYHQLSSTIIDYHAPFDRGFIQWNPAIRPPRYYDHFFVAPTKANTFSYLKTPVNTTTPFLRPLFCGSNKSPHILLFENPVNPTTPLLRPTTTFSSPQSLFSL